MTIEQQLQLERIRFDYVLASLNRVLGPGPQGQSIDRVLVDKKLREKGLYPE